MNGPEISWLPDRRRLHFNHGPIDLIVEAWGDPKELQAAYRQAAARFETILPELVGELTELRRPASTTPRNFLGSTAQRMEAAVAPLSRTFITPMAAVAGSVADEMMAAMVAGRRLDRAYVNNGGDIALQIAPGQEISAAIADTGHGLADRLTIRAEDPVRGIATSGWRGRSFSLGIADAVTVLAVSAAAADAAATLIANAVDLPGHRAIQRQPARDLAPDNDLGDRLVTTGVGPLDAEEIELALEAGLSIAETLRRQGSIQTAALYLGGRNRISGTHELAVAGNVTRGVPVHA
ncbi:hypothetical protein HNQ96_003776 [Aminobacter lissarensis]|uniref:Uncharacterized protein n=1 Tax=Aminobacter carboxidus TaxID=376165 RepID=A0A8E1WH54_9HYPH|nr:UPF0280 family protein [Aminobacter lissarensis]MBB6467893.1 hypothetical protein [Aminobacter lissarensis]